MRYINRYSALLDAIKALELAERASLNAVNRVTGDERTRALAYTRWKAKADVRDRALIEAESAALAAFPKLCRKSDL
jgi:hypothetical protein